MATNDARQADIGPSDAERRGGRQGGQCPVTDEGDDFGFGDDFDEIDFDDVEPDQTSGRAALMCREGESLTVRFEFYETADDAVAAARTCSRAACVGDHLIVSRDDRGALRTFTAPGRDVSEFRDLLAQLAAARIERRREGWRGRKAKQRTTTPQEDTRK
ncbi:hypothetical protein [Mycobacterium attenuatum]|uniref:hypothetical protein n=1 Tax=Mycobacterium attenuatum TaxID=2341086 RepID=UPI000F2204AD|nr:hypothetical protein [Mycobacterium attenuatum]VBA47908.1 hypothetical protein LAUMK41_00635 [Mycobacterium attenuatum]